MSKRISFSDPVRLTILYGACTVSMIAEREKYQNLCDAVAKIDAPQWVSIVGMINDFDANAIRMFIKIEEIVSIECTEVNS